MIIARRTGTVRRSHGQLIITRVLILRYQVRESPALHQETYFTQSRFTRSIFVNNKIFTTFWIIAYFFILTLNILFHIIINAQYIVVYILVMGKKNAKYGASK